MARYRLVHVGVAAALAAGVMATISVVQGVNAVANTATGSEWVPIVPCRLMDTREATNVGDRDTPLEADETATVMVTGENGDCLIPLYATGVTANVTATNPTAASYLTVFAADAERPNTSNLNWKGGNQPVANQVSVALSPSVEDVQADDGSLSIYNHAGAVDVIVDITGYYIESEGGAQGPQGEPGVQGPQGEPGVQGPQGEPGQGGLGDLGCADQSNIIWSASEQAWICEYEIVEVVAMLHRFADHIDTPESPLGVWDEVSGNVFPGDGSCTTTECNLRIGDYYGYDQCQVEQTVGSNGIIPSSFSYYQLYLGFDTALDTNEAAVTITCQFRVYNGINY